MGVSSCSTSGLRRLLVGTRRVGLGESPGSSYAGGREVGQRHPRADVGRRSVDDEIHPVGHAGTQRLLSAGKLCTIDARCVFHENGRVTGCTAGEHRGINPECPVDAAYSSCLRAALESRAVPQPVIADLPANRSPDFYTDTSFEFRIAP